MCNKSALKWAFIALLFVVSPTFAELVTLDVESDQTKEWLEVSCVYVTDPLDFWVFGCPAGIPDGEDRFPTQKGYWSPCTAQRCEIHYFGGSRVTSPKSITFSSYSSGSLDIFISSKYSPLDEEFSDVEHISIAGKGGWRDLKILMDSRSPGSLILNFTLVIKPEEVFVIDKVTIDLGEDGTLPPITSTTTPIPIIDDVLTLENDSDYWKTWDHNCTYTDDPYDMWAYGCPASTELGREENAGHGFWGSCTNPICRIQFMAGPLLFLSPPRAITVNGYLEGDTKIDVVLQPDPFDLTLIPIGVVTSDGSNGGIVNQTFQLEDFTISESYRLNFNLVNDHGYVGGAVIDNIKLKLWAKATTFPTRQTNDPTGPGVTETDSTGPGVTGSDSTGPGVTGSDFTGPGVTGSDSTGPGVTGSESTASNPSSGPTTTTEGSGGETFINSWANRNILFLLSLSLFSWQFGNK